MNNNVYTWEKDIKPYINHYIPNYLDVYKPSKRQMLIIEKKYNERYEHIKEEIEKHSIFENETTIFDLLWKAYEQDEGSIAFLKFIDNLCKSLKNKLDETSVHKLKMTFFEIINNFDRKHSKYLCAIGELACLNKLLGDKNIKFLSKEEKLPNNKSFDFLLSINGNEVLVEILNIFYNKEKINTDEELGKFLDYRFVKKLEDKFKDIDIEKKYDFTLIPVLWGDLTDFEKHSKFIEEFKPPNNIVSPIMTVYPYRNRNTEELKYVFLGVKEFVERINEREKYL